MAPSTEEISQFRLADKPKGAAEARFHPAIRTLPKRLSSIAFALLQRTPEGDAIKPTTYDELDAWERKLNAALQQLGKLAEPDRVRILEIFFADFTPVVDAIWRRMQAGDRPLWNCFDPPSWVEMQNNGWYFLQGFLWFVCDYDLAALDEMRMLRNHDQYQTDQRSYHELIPVLLAHKIDAGGEPAAALLAELARQERATKQKDLAHWHFLYNVLLSVDQPAVWRTVFERIPNLKPAYDHRRMILKASLAGNSRALDELVRFVITHQPEILEDFQFAGTFGHLIDESGDLISGLQRWLAFCDDEKLRRKALMSKEARDVAIALSVEARRSRPSAYEACDRLLEHASPAVRCVATRFLFHHSTRAETVPLRIKALNDADDRVAYFAVFGNLLNGDCALMMAPYRPLVKALLKLVKRLPAEATESPTAEWPFPQQSLGVDNVSEELIDSYDSNFRDLLYAARASLSPSVRESLERD